MNNLYWLAAIILGAVLGIPLLVLFVQLTAQVWRYMIDDFNTWRRRRRPPA